MEDREREPDIAKMAGAELERLVACFASSCLAGGAQAGIEGSMPVWHAAVVDVIEEAVGNLKNALADNMLI